MVHFYLPPSPPSLNETYKIVHWPHPPSGNRNKLCFSWGELINTLWLFKFNSTFNIWFSLCKGFELCGNRNTKLNIGHVTKRFRPLPHKNMSLFWWTNKLGFFYSPPPYMDQCPLLSQFVLKASLSEQKYGRPFVESISSTAAS